MYFGYVPQNGKCISLYNHRIYSPVCRYKTHEAGHGNARGRPHISILGNRDADDRWHLPLMTDFSREIIYCVWRPIKNSFLINEFG